MSLLNKVQYLHLDVFANSRGGGNHLGVVTDATGWTDEQMQRFAKWTNLVETTFLLPPTAPNASYRVRIFTPSKEIPFAGHPSIGSAHAALDCKLVTPNKDNLIYQECGAGVLPIRILDPDHNSNTRQLLLQSPKAKVIRTGIDAHSHLAASLVGINLGRLPPALVEGGRHWWLAECETEEQLRQWKPDHKAILALAKETNCLGVCVFARAQDSNVDYQLVVRALPAGVGIVEDPASGAANGLIGAYIAHAEPNGPLANGYVVSQGREIGHDARLVVQIDHKDGIIWIGGRTNTMVDGTLQWS